MQGSAVARLQGSAVARLVEIGVVDVFADVL